MSAPLSPLIPRIETSENELSPPCPYRKVFDRSYLRPVDLRIFNELKKQFTSLTIDPNKSSTTPDQKKSITLSLPQRYQTTDSVVSTHFTTKEEPQPSFSSSSANTPSTPPQLDLPLSSACSTMCSSSNGPSNLTSETKPFSQLTPSWLLPRHPCNDPRVMRVLRSLGFSPSQSKRFASGSESPEFAFLHNIWDQLPVSIIPISKGFSEAISSMQYEAAVSMLLGVLKEAHDFFLIRCFPEIDEAARAKKLSQKFPNIPQKNLEDAWFLTDPRTPQERADDIRAYLKSTAAKTSTTLTLSGKHLPFILPEIRDCTWIKKLNLSFNKLLNIPSWITMMPNLQILELQSNQLTGLPIEIGEMKNLQTLLLSHNQISEIPKGLSFLTKLIEIDISFNNVTEIPFPLSSLQSLQTFSATENQLKQLDLGDIPSQQLTTVYLGNNELLSIPQGIERCTGLSKLHLQHNRIISLPDFLSAQSHLFPSGEYLSPEYRKMFYGTSVEDKTPFSTFKEWPKLQFFSIKENPLPIKTTTSTTKCIEKD